jgi:hypothetical protein
MGNRADVDNLLDNIDSYKHKKQSLMKSNGYYGAKYFAPFFEEN